MGIKESDVEKVSYGLDGSWWDNVQWFSMKVYGTKHHSNKLHKGQCQYNSTNEVPSKSKYIWSWIAFMKGLTDPINGWSCTQIKPTMICFRHIGNKPLHIKQIVK